MSTIEESLRKEETEFLQEKIRTNSYIAEVTDIAIRILKERNAEIPIPETEEESEVKYKNNSQVSLILFVLTSSFVLALYFGDVTFSRFIVFTILYVIAFRYTLTMRKK